MLHTHLWYVVTHESMKDLQYFLDYVAHAPSTIKNIIHYFIKLIILPENVSGTPIK